MQKHPGDSTRLPVHGEAAVQQKPKRDSQHERSAEPASNSEQSQPASGEQPEACEEALTAPPQPMPASNSSDAPAEPEQASVGAASDQHTSAESSQPADIIMASQSAGAKPASDQHASAEPSEPASAAVPSESTEIKGTPASEQCQPLSPQQLKVAAAVMVVLRRALNNSVHAISATKEVLISNLPQAEHLLQLVPEGTELPSLKQLEEQASPALREWLDAISELCTESRVSAAEAVHQERSAPHIPHSQHI